jgi:2-polyprenyl-3-methyl-5-hydroxy-6-metoxy-1,4-benzoquinol methylase
MTLVKSRFRRTGGCVVILREWLASRYGRRVMGDTASTRLAYASLSPLRTRIEVHRRYSEQPDDLEQAVEEAVDAAGTAAVLDVGCGTGSFLRRLAGNGAGRRLVGVDPSTAAVSSLNGVAAVAAVGRR